MQEQNSKKSTKQTWCIEENLTIDGEKLQYSLSNNLEDIEIAIFERTSQNIKLKDAYWYINNKLFSGVKHLMKKHKVGYSFTVSNSNNTKDLVVNMCANDEWFITGFREIKKIFYPWDVLDKLDAIKEAIKEYSEENSKKIQEAIDSIEKAIEENQNEISENLKKEETDECKKITINEFFKYYESFFEKYKKKELTLKEIKNDLNTHINQNMHLDFCNKIKSYELNENDLFLLLCFCYLFISVNDNNITFSDLKMFFDDNVTIHLITSSFLEGSNILIKNKFIECNEYLDKYNSETWKLTEKIKTELFSEIYTKINHKRQKNIILYNDIKDRKMVYNSKENEAIKKLTSFLLNDNFVRILERLNEKDMRNGFTCLFSGLPGTGKTETVYQIARETKRNIMKVDISETKSMWLGESEKRIKAIFDSYREAVKDAEIAPILLLNEAEAVIGKRIELTNGNRSIDKTENRIQNIILEEMENFFGILIATTNLTQNMDSAFERRFLYKINFDKPGTESRKSIWNVFLPALSEDITSKLSESFEFSGGQIENIARKAEIDTILNGDEPSIDTLLQYCDEECNNSFHSGKRIGFGSDIYKKPLSF